MSRARRLGAARLLSFAVSLAPGACVSGAPDPTAPAGSVGVARNAALEAMVRENGGRAVALLLPPISADRPERVVLARHAAAAPARVLARLRDVERYPEFVDRVARVAVRERGEEELLFDAELEMPFQNLEYTLRYVFAADGRVDVFGEAGVLEGGRWCWQVLPSDDGALVVYTSEGEIGDGAGFVLRKILDSDPDLQPGLAFAQGLRFLRAICAAAERAAEGETP